MSQSEWLKSAQDGNQEGYEDVVVAEVAYGDNAKTVILIRKGTFLEQSMLVMLK